MLLFVNRRPTQSAAAPNRGLRDRLFFLYLTAYGLFRFFHEFMRDTPKIVLSLSGYQFIALGMAMIGFVMLRQRSQSMLALTATNRQP